MYGLVPNRLVNAEHSKTVIMFKHNNKYTKKCLYIDSSNYYDFIKCDNKVLYHD